MNEVVEPSSLRKVSRRSSCANTSETTCLTTRLFGSRPSAMTIELSEQGGCGDERKPESESQEIDHVTVLAATETMKHERVRKNHERRMFVLVKWTLTHPKRANPLQRHDLSDTLLDGYQSCDVLLL